MLLVNNPKCQAIKIMTEEQGFMEWKIKEDEIPFLLYVEDDELGRSFEYQFLDAEGKEI